MMNKKNEYKIKKYKIYEVKVKVKKKKEEERKEGRKEGKGKNEASLRERYFVRVKKRVFKEKTM